jgi:hypothetical protein
MTPPIDAAVTGLRPAFVGAVLNVLDKHQARALNWGFLDLTITAHEIEDLLSVGLPEQFRIEWVSLCASHGYDADVLASELAGANLLYADPTRHGRYRTRFAEGVRLIGRLRQTFRPQQWATSPALVSDLKVRVAERRLPVRGESLAVCWEDLKHSCRHERVQGAAFEALATTPEGQPISFAAFQRRSFIRILSEYGGSGASGTVVSAETGAGKTKAFYIPALLGVVSDIADDPEAYTKVIAVYPRNVLLADQLREAISEASKLRHVLSGFGYRDITFGALLGDTPPGSDAFEGRDGRPSYMEQFTEWHRVPSGWEIPYLRSPVRADKSLIWRDEDRRHGRTALYRTDGAVAGADVPDGVLRLTRAELQREPPDVLFVSLEMLNQHMGNPDWSRTFGLANRSQKPRLLLLDEVHTHEGIPGAQAAWVFRRWRHWGAINDVHVVGLSATLKNAPEHLSRVAGLDPALVVEHRPAPREFESIDVDLEYGVVVKGNPAAGTSLLATSIQAAMLIPRLLTPRTSSREFGALGYDTFFGRRVFAFTDKLDVVNRWLADLTDAEINRRLAALRAIPDALQTPQDVMRAKERDGQVWRLPAQLGHDLTQSLAVTRCSSQDPGASANSDLIVATSSLEVGYDDPDVGATLHHKRPRSMASFIQRKGRAGRRRRMRPWTVVILSDYGADRWAFQNAEILLTPEVGDIALPLKNAHVLRMQSAFFLLDWIGRRLSSHAPFDYLRPSKAGGERKFERVRGRTIGLLRDMLAEGDAWRDFLHDFRSCFRFPEGRGRPALSDAELDALLWQPPRPLLVEAIPELLRKLERSWRLADPSLSPDMREDSGARRPMPRQVPSATFAELELGEARIEFPAALRKEPETLSVARVLAETAIGNVSKRYSVRRNEPGYWHPFSVRLAGNQVIPLSVSVAELFAERLFIGAVGDLNVFEPQVIPVVQITRAVRDTSNGRWVWNLAVRNVGAGLLLPVFGTPVWRRVFADCVAYLHRDHGWLEVIRYATEGRYEIRDGRGNSRAGRIALRSADAEDQPGHSEAVGFRKDVDGIILRLPAEAYQDVPALSASELADLRTEFFRDGIRESGALGDDISVFLRDWLSQMALAMLTATAALKNDTLHHAHEMLGSSRARAADKVLDSIFQLRDVEVAHGDEEARLRTRLRALWRDPGVVDEITRIEARLWEPLGEDFTTWARRRHVATLAQAFRAAALSRVPEISEDDLALDVVWGVADATIVLTEVESGGVGIIERVVAAMRAAPDRFHAAFRHHIRWCPRAEAAEAVGLLVHEVLQPTETGRALASAFRQVRAVDTLREAEAAIYDLRLALDAAGHAPTRRIIVALMGKLLQPGTSAALDALVFDLDQRRSTLATSLRVWPASEAFAYHVIHVDDIRAQVLSLLRDVGQQEADEHQLFATVQRLLVDGCRDSCPECLDQPNRFTDFGKPARSLTGAWLQTSPACVRVHEGTAWRNEATQYLLEDGRVSIVAAEADMRAAVGFVQETLAEEVPRGYLLLPAFISRVQRRGVDWELMLELGEAGDA